MPQTLGAEGDAQLASGRYASAYLVDMLFAGGTLNLCTLPIPVQANGNTYTGLGQFLQVDVVSVSEDGKADKINLSLGITNEAMLANVLGNVAGYRGRRVRIWLAAFSDTFVPKGTPALEWQGFMEPVQISRSLGAQGITGRIKMPCTRAGLARSRNAQGLRVTHAQRLALYPGDLGCEYLATLMEQPTTWLTKRFQEVD